MAQNNEPTIEFKKADQDTSPYTTSVVDDAIGEHAR